jgi:hypothetical protein
MCGVPKAASTVENLTLKLLCSRLVTCFGDIQYLENSQARLIPVEMI